MSLSTRSIAGLMMALAVVIFFAANDAPLGAAPRRCQEECDAMYAACQWNCDNTDACDGDDTCQSVCRMSCIDPYSSCTYGAYGCGENYHPSAGCTVIWYGAWDLGDGWYSFYDPDAGYSNFSINCRVL